MGDLTRYVFRSVWDVEASFDDVFAVLWEFDAYPRWWPEIREVRRLDLASFDTVCRSLLPYDLRFVTELAHGDPEAGTIEAALSGDLDGFSRWSLDRVDGRSTRAVYDQEVVTHKRLLNALAPVARPVFKTNHAVMMRHGRAGLRAYLAGYRRGRAGPTPG